MTKEEKIIYCKKQAEKFNIYHYIIWDELSDSELNLYVEWINTYSPY
jgi:hypothetical protein